MTFWLGASLDIPAPASDIRRILGLSQKLPQFLYDSENRPDCEQPRTASIARPKFALTVLFDPFSWQSMFLCTSVSHIKRKTHDTAMQRHLAKF